MGRLDGKVALITGAAAEAYIKKVAGDTSLQALKDAEADVKKVR